MNCSCRSSISQFAGLPSRPSALQLAAMLAVAFDKNIANQKKRVGKDRSASTLWAMERSRKDVADFIQSHYRRTDMSMLELTPEFIKDFAAYLSTDRRLANGTIWQRCMWLKGVVLRAHYNGKIPRNPFAQFHISPNCKEREFLTEEELKTVVTHEFEDDNLAFVRDIFVFVCFVSVPLSANALICATKLLKLVSSSSTSEAASRLPRMYCAQLKLLPCLFSF